MIKSTIREFYLLSALTSVATNIFGATYAIFLLSKGLNLFEVSLVNLVFFTVLFLCEIPTGAFADVFGRKASYIVAMALIGAGSLTYSVSSTFLGFAFAETLAAIGTTFASGAFRAWFVDKLHHHGYDGKLGSIFARAGMIKQIVGIVATIAGSFLASRNMTYPWIISGVFFFIAGIISCFLKEEYFIAKKFSFKEGLVAMKQTAQSSIKYGFGNRNVGFVMIIVVAQLFAVQAPNMQWQPFFGKFLENSTHLGFIMAGIKLSLLFGTWLAPRILMRITDERKALSWCQLIIGIGIATTGMFEIFPVAILVFLLHEAARGAFEPIKDAYLHDNIPSKERATIDSFESLANHGGGMIGLLVSGYIALHAGIPTTWAVAGLVLVISTILVMRNGKKKQSH